MMQVVNTINDLRQLINNWRLAGKRIAFVPTMGNLHAGHLRLVEVAKQCADKVVVSIFVNPTQFGVGEDFAAYPRTLAEDSDKLQQIATDLLFLPDVNEIYPNQPSTTVSVKPLSTLHCGAFRPGHFDGVATVVTKLFNIVQPDVACFGLKDYQQLAVIKTLVRDLNIPIEIKPVATERDTDGLALSSRNGYLTAAERALAPKLYQSLCAARDKLIANKKRGLTPDFTEIEQTALAFLQDNGFQPDYFSICDADSLQLANASTESLVILAAARLGKARLIDNITV